MFNPSLVQNDLNYQYGGSTCHAYATQSCNQYIFKKGYSTLGGRGWGQLMGIRAEIGMPSCFYRVVIVELAGWSAHAGGKTRPGEAIMWGSRSEVGWMIPFAAF